MANHPSALKRIRQTENRRIANKYHAKSTRSALKTLRQTSSKEDAEKLFPEVSAMLDKLAKQRIIHKNKAANLKSGLAKHVQSL